MAIDARTAPEVPTQGDDDGGRDWVKILVLIGAVAFLAACGIYIGMNRGEAPTPGPTPTAVVDSQQAAYEASTKTITDYLAWRQSNLGKNVPSTFASQGFADQVAAFDASLVKDGQRLDGADKLLWVKPLSFNQQTTVMKTCSEVHAKLLDKDGTNVRVDPSGNPIAEGSQIGVTYHLTPGAERGSWIISSDETTASC